MGGPAWDEPASAPSVLSNRAPMLGTRDCPLRVRTKRVPFPFPAADSKRRDSPVLRLNAHYPADVLLEMAAALRAKTRPAIAARDATSIPVPYEEREATAAVTGAPTATPIVRTE